MFVCRLFHSDQPNEELAARLLASGEISIGRDPAADWPLPDPDGTLSRIHCTLAIRDGTILLRDSSTNGTFLGNGRRAPRDQLIAIDPLESLHLGALTIRIDRLALVDDGGDTGRTVIHMPAATVAAALPHDWLDGVTPPPRHRDASLIEAFCEGANLDASALSAEDPAELMQRVGAIYQQTLIGLATLMAERNRMKSDYQLDRTAIGPLDNNPFKWTATRRLAQDLLTGGASGFLSDAAAVRASFEDLGGHMAAVAEGARVALQLVMDDLAPAAIEAECQSQGPSLRSRASRCWDLHRQRHAALASADAPQQSPIVRAFGAAYDRAHDRPRR
ncbi:MAG: hypothetical protein JWN59_103 [Sphingomonas bacterium]|nr:hypothetical protein [Sphingomonas bacterium]